MKRQTMFATVFIRVILLLLIFSLLGTSCRQKAKFERGFGYTFAPQSIMMGVRSNTDIFEKDSLSLDISYGLHDIGYDKKYNYNPKSGYTLTGYNNVFFGVYICDYDNALDLVNGIEISDYQNVEKYSFVKYISEDEAFTGKYGYTMNYWKGITYDHSESINIPSDFLTDTSGKFAIKVVAFNEPIEDGGKYIVSDANHLTIGYKAENDKTIKILF